MAKINRRYKRKRSSFPFFLIVTLLLAGAGGYVFLTYFEGEKPHITSHDIPPYMGNKTPVSFTVTDKKSGLRSIKIVATQNGKEKQVFAKEFPRQGKDSTTGTFHEDIQLKLSAKALGLKEGEAVLQIEATDYSFRGLLKGNSSIISHTFTIDTKPPRISIIHSEKYIEPGGAGIVINLYLT